MEVFVAAAELGSFSAAGRRLKLSPSAVSKLVTRIEDRLGTRLLARSTRVVTLTPEGEIYLSRARRILADIADTEQIVAGGGKVVPRGLLRVNATLGFGERYLLPLAPEFLSLYPEIELDISLTDGVISLIEERTDIAIRSGGLADSSLKARKLKEVRRIIVPPLPISKNMACRKSRRIWPNTIASASISVAASTNGLFVIPARRKSTAFP